MYSANLIKDDKIVPFDDDKALEDYTRQKIGKNLIQANMEEKANQVRRETPKQFFAKFTTRITNSC